MNATLELNMPEVMTEGPGLWGTIGAGITAAVAILYTLWGNLRRGGQAAETDTETLKLVQAAVEHWKSIANTAWEQAAKEQAMRVAADQRAQLAMQEVEGLRSEVGMLRREIERLTAQINNLAGAQ